MSILLSSKGINYERLRPGSVEDAAALVGEAFSRHEPLSLSVRADAGAFARSIVDESGLFVREGFSVVATDAASNSVCGVILAHDFTTYGFDSSGAIGALLTELDDHYREIRPVSANSFLHIYMIAVDERYHGQGIATSLVGCSVQIGADRGFTHVVVEATNLVSQRVLQKAGFEALREIVYRDYTYEGDRPFASIQDHPSIVLMERIMPER